MFKKPFKVKSLSIKLPKKKDDKKSYKKIFLYGAFSLFSLSFISFCIYVGMVISSAPELDEIRNFTFAESTVIYDKTGEYKLFSVYGEENRRIVNIDQISPNFINAILAAEDDEFFAHPGFDLGGIAMAVCHEASSKAGLGNLGGLCPQRGGSTLTQQLVKNVLLSSEKAYSRKIKEWYLSWKIEQKMKKNEILELYANNVSFGSMNGIETASQVFFGKHAKDLTIAESAVLAAIPQRPTYFSPYGNHAFTEITVSEDEIQQKGYKTYEDIENLPGITIVIGLKGKDIFLADGEKDYFPGRADWILKRMNDLGFIKEVEYKEASEELKSLEFKQARNNIQAPHFVMYTKEILEDKFGKELIEKGGLKVVTTLDYGLQKEAERIIAEKAKSNEERFSATNSSLVSIAPETGHILAMVGSRDFFEEETNDGKVNVMLQRRLPGSSFKPIVYAAAFDKGLSPATVLFDTKTDFGSDWVPKNYDGKFSGPVQIRKALGTSLNIPAVKACIITGSEKVVELANKMGINLLNDAEFYGNAISLGAGEARGIDMTQAFSIFANNGKKVNLTPILKVYDRNGNLLMDNTIPPEEKEQILNEQTAYLITDILSDSEARGEGWNMHLQLSDRKNAVKTGTSNKKIKNIT
ncbi:MAG: penicillin-binding protein, partial [Candidatus Gracilibacteria bacterium]|nr:penicillin-binding protein [Candidatus Gracilibacteria bacterium]